MAARGQGGRTQRSREAALSEDDVERLRGELNSGTRPTVWFTGAAVGVEEGQSGKLVAFTEPADGEFIRVKPAGSSDVLSFSPGELTASRPGTPAKASVTRSGSPRAAAPQSGKQQAGGREPVVRQAPAKPTAGRPRGVRPVVMTISSTEEGEWRVEVMTGKKRVVRPTAVAPSVVASVATTLGAQVSEAVGAALEAAREAQRARVEHLQAELDDARKALEELSGK